MYICIWLIPPGFMNLLLLFPCQELYSVLSFAGHLTDFSRDSQGLSKPLSDQALPTTKPDQKMESTSENSSPCHLSCSQDPLLPWCHAGSCRVTECAVGHQSRNWSSMRHMLLCPFPLKNNLALWLGPWSPVTGHTSWLTRHSPPHGCCLSVHLSHLEVVTLFLSYSFPLQKLQKWTERPMRSPLLCLAAQLISVS